jgi:hypothetical protein
MKIRPFHRDFHRFKPENQSDSPFPSSQLNDAKSQETNIANQKILIGIRGIE